MYGGQFGQQQEEDSHVISWQKRSIYSSLYCHVIFLIKLPFHQVEEKFRIRKTIITIIIIIIIIIITIIIIMTREAERRRSLDMASMKQADEWRKHEIIRAQVTGKVKLSLVTLSL